MKSPANTKAFLIKLQSKIWLTTILLLIIAGPSRAEVTKGLTQITFNNNGGWCWFEDERAVIYQGQLFFGTVANGSGAEGKARAGNIEVTSYDFSSGKIKRFTLHEHLFADDHNSPALLIRPDGRLLATYSRHNRDPWIRWRISTKSADISEWQPEKTYDQGVTTTYSNLFHLPAENNGKGRTYLFARSTGWDPNALVSNDAGTTWTSGGRLLNAPGRPYLKYASNGKDTIHFLTTEQHPRNFNNSIYHGYLRNGTLFRSDGTRVADFDSVGKSPTDFTKIYSGDANHVAWTIDMHLDAKENPYLVFSVRMNKNRQDFRYFYGRWDGTRWHVHPLAFAGSCLYAREPDYTGLVALNPANPNEVYLSADVDPQTGKPLISTADSKRHYEIFRGVTSDGGASWRWNPITKNSTADNLRPIMPMPQGKHSALLWLSGTFSTYTDYDLKVVGILLSNKKKTAK